MLGQKTGKRGTDITIGRWSAQVLKHLPGARKGKRGGSKEMSEERCRRVGVSGSLRGRRSEEMAQSNTSPKRGLEVSL